MLKRYDPEDVVWSLNGVQISDFGGFEKGMSKAKACEIALEVITPLAKGERAQAREVLVGLGVDPDDWAEVRAAYADACFDMAGS